MLCIKRSEYGSPSAFARMPTALVAMNFFALRSDFLPVRLPTGRTAPLHHALSILIRATREPPTVARADQRVIRISVGWLLATVHAPVVGVRLHALLEVPGGA